MAASLRELVWAAGLLEHCPDVDALTVRVEADWLRADPRHVPILQMDVHAATCEDAVRLVSPLGLAARAGRESDGGQRQWRTWAGWVPDASRVLPVNLRVTAAEHLIGKVA
jgi:hypothetical protein